MSNKVVDVEAEILLDRKEARPQIQALARGVVLCKNSHGLYLDINKCFEAQVGVNELGSKTLDEYLVGESLEVLITEEERNFPGVFKASIKQVQESQKWEQLSKLKEQNLKVKIHKILKSGIEVLIQETNQIGFIPFGYLNTLQEPLRSNKRETWSGLEIEAKLHEFDKTKNKIILDHKTPSEAQKEKRAQELLAQLELGSVIEGTVIRLVEFGAFVDLGGFDALIPLSELAWQRFKRAEEIVQIGQKIQAKIFRIEPESKRITLSLKQMQSEPWTRIPEEFRVGFQGSAKVVSQAEFGVFVELSPGIEALLHKSQFTEVPAIDSILLVEITNFDIEKKRIGVKLQQNEEAIIEEKELEHVN